MRTTDILSQEHRVIEQVLSCLEASLKDPDHFDCGAASKMLDFFRNFADRCHHGKEEDRLFPRMEARGFSPSFGPTAVMRFEHEQGRKFMANMASAIRGCQRGDTGAFDAYKKAATSYVDLLRAHIHKEDCCLFPLANQFLKDGDDAELLKQFDEAEHADGFEGEHEKYLALADELAEQFGVCRSPVIADHRVLCGCGH